jgi:WD40 repeat protein
MMPLDSQGKSNEIIYSKKYGIESFNLVTGKQQTLCMLGGDEESNYDKYTICMDVIKNNKGDYSLCTGRADGSVNLYYVSSSELNRVKEYKSNVVPKFDNYLSKVISQGNTDEILTNYVKFLKNHNKENLLLTTGNDGYVRIFDLQKNMNIVNEIKADHPVNNCDISNDGNILTCVGDSTNVEIFDLRTSKTCLKFNSHYDYGVVIKYLPENDYIFATGNQDFSCKIWDIRKIQVIGNNLNKMCSPVNHLSGYFESIGDLCFTKNKNFLIFAENADYLHIYNIKYQKIQTMTYISSFSGLAYDNDKERIYIGIEDDVTAGIICYDIINNNTLNSTNL